MRVYGSMQKQIFLVCTGGVSHRFSAKVSKSSSCDFRFSSGPPQGRKKISLPLNLHIGKLVLKTDFRRLNAPPLHPCFLRGTENLLLHLPVLIKIKYSYSYSLPTDMHVKNLCKKTRKRLRIKMRLQYLEGKRESLTVNQQINK